MYLGENIPLLQFNNGGYFSTKRCTGSFHLHCKQVIKRGRVSRGPESPIHILSCQKDHSPILLGPLFLGVSCCGPNSSKPVVTWKRLECQYAFHFLREQKRKGFKRFSSFFSLFLSIHLKFFLLYICLMWKGTCLFELIRFCLSSLYILRLNLVSGYRLRKSVPFFSFRFFFRLSLPSTVPLKVTLLKE